MSAGYLDPHAGMNSPLSPRGPRSMSHPPPGMAPSPAARGMHPMQHAQMMAMAGGNYGDASGQGYDGLIPLPPHESQYGGQWQGHNDQQLSLHEMHGQQQHYGHHNQQLDHHYHQQQQQQRHDNLYGPLTPSSGDSSAPQSGGGYAGRSFSQQQQLGLGQRPSYDYGQPQQEYAGQT